MPESLIKLTYSYPRRPKIGQYEEYIPEEHELDAETTITWLAEFTKYKGYTIDYRSKVLDTGKVLHRFDIRPSEDRRKNNDFVYSLYEKQLCQSK